jgi:hypothetical protein
MSTRMFRRHRNVAALAPIATAVMVAGLVTAAPASSAPDTGTVAYSGTVTCAKAFPNSKSVPQKVFLDSDEDDTAGATKSVVNRRATYGPLSLEAPLDSQFTLTVTVTCKAPKVQSQTFTRNISQTDLVENEQVKLNIK